MTYDDLLSLVKQRRSVRRFTSDPIPEELIGKIIEAARWAPSGFNMQPWEFVVVRKLALRKKIVEITSSYWQQSLDMEKARPAWQGRTWKLTGMTDEKGDYTDAPVYILLCGDPRTQTGLPMGVQCDSHRRWLIYQSSLANVFLFMHLAATTLGLASQWYSTVQVPYAACMIKELLGIPDELEVYDMMVLGYPAVTPPEKFMRDKEEMIHWDDDPESYRNDEQVRAFVKKARNWTIGTHSRKADGRD
jgi:nitroreductase